MFFKLTLHTKNSFRSSQVYQGEMDNSIKRKLWVTPENSLKDRSLYGQTKSIMSILKYLNIDILYGSELITN